MSDAGPTLALRVLWLALPSTARGDVGHVAVADCWLAAAIDGRVGAAAGEQATAMDGV